MSRTEQFATGMRRTTGALTVGALAATAAIPAMTHEAPVGGWVGSPSQVALAHQGKPSNIPSWNHHLSQQFDGFKDIERKPEHVIPSRVVAVQQSGQPRTYSFDRAWDLNTGDKNPANDVYVVGGRW